MTSGAGPAGGAHPAGVAWESAAVASHAAVTLAAVPGVRAFVGAEASLLVVAAAVVVMHGVAWACRRWLGSLGLGAGVAACAVIPACVVFPATTALGLPLAGTWRAAGSGVRRALEAFGTGLPAVAEEAAAVREGRMALAVGFACLCALLADQAAFRLHRPLFSLLPSLTVVVLGGLRAPSAPPVHWWLVATGAFLLVDRAASAAAGGAATPPAARLAGAGPGAAVLAAVAVLAGLLVGPAVPGYGSDPLVVGVAQRPGPESSRIGAFVDLRPTLTERSDEVMFTVASRVAAYWRLTSLDVFDGTTWTQSAAEAERESVPTTGFVSGTGVAQDVRIEALRSAWLPAAYRVQQVGGRDLAVAGDSSTLRGESTSRFGQRYQVISHVPYLTVQSLRAAGGRPPTGGLRRYLDLPDDLPPSVRAEAFRAAGPRGESEPLATALRLQTWFRQRFTYDLSVPRGAGSNALERFLFETRRGYCEQFAGAFAVLARAVGLPARVAVGFTPGDLGDDGRYRVRGLHAHAWPEVHLEGAGWVAFEPTPGRGNPTAEAYTGVAPAQASSDEVAPPAVAPTAATAPAAAAVGAPTTAPPPAAPARPQEPASPATTAVPAQPASGPPATARDAGGGLAAAAALGVLALAVAAVPLVKRWRRSARRRRATAPSERVLVAWEEAAEALGAAGMARRPSETLLVHAARVVADDRLPAEVAGPVLALARRAGTASYAAGPLGAVDAEEAAGAAAAVTGALGRAAPVTVRLARAVDPRPLVRRDRGSGAEAPRRGSAGEDQAAPASAT